MVCDYDVLSLLLPTGLDIVFEAVDGPHPDPRAVPILREEIVPVASPGFMERFAPVMAGHPLEWRDVTSLGHRPAKPRLGDIPATNTISIPATGRAMSSR